LVLQCRRRLRQPSHAWRQTGRLLLHLLLSVHVAQVRQNTASGQGW
jgi:hypothetical protein